MPESALLVVDLQKDLCTDSRRKDKVAAMLPSVLRAIDLFARTDQLVIYAYFALSEGDAQFKRFGDRYCIEGTEGAELIDELFPLRGPTLRKRKHSAFFDTELDELLSAVNVRTLYLVGMQTHICIMTTAMDASYRGYRAVAVSDCVLSSSEDKKDSALEWIAAYAGDVLTLAEVATELSHA